MGEVCPQGGGISSTACHTPCVERFDVVVVGAGAAGSAAARSLAGSGRSCALIERFELGHAAGSSHGSTRIFRLAYHHPDYVRMALRALEAWKELEDDAGERLLIRGGGLDIGGWAAEAAAAMDEAGVSYEWLSPAEMEERWEGVRAPPGRALFQPDAAVCMAERATSSLVRLAEQDGARVLPGTPAESIVPTGEGVEVRTADRAFRAASVIVAAGGWTGPLLAPLGIALPLSVTQEQVLYLRREPAPPIPSVIEWTSPATYAVADPEGASLKVGEHHAKREVTADDRGYEVDPASIERARSWGRERFRGLAAEERTETCLYTNTPDEDFVIDRVGPVVISSACSGHGFKFTPLLGKLLAELATGAEPSVPLDRFRAGRFEGAA
ncbi:MAG: N-methyl-L-tryptophan oxidase [Actinomycetota bacterium]|nr:N-methyl-L-tryptophan oxidase [Actinomycetota bacterium]